MLLYQHACIKIDNDDHRANFSQGTLENFNALGYLAGDGCHNIGTGILSIVCESLMFLELLFVTKMLGVYNPRFE